MIDNNAKYGVYKSKVPADKRAMGEIRGKLVTVAKGIQVEVKPGKTEEQTIYEWKLKHSKL